MDSKAAEEYHKFLHVKLRENKTSATTLVWVPVLAVSGYYALSGIAGAIFGGLIGYAVCGIMGQVGNMKTTAYYIELIRHLHEHTDEAEAGKLQADIEVSIKNVTTKWWHSK